MIVDEHEKIILSSFFDGLRPIKRITVSQWSNENRILSSVSSSEPGPYRYQRTPYLRKVMDYLSIISLIWEIIVMKGSQVGFTDAGNNWIGYTIDVDPGPMLLVMPTEGAIKKNSKTRITPMINSTPSLKAKIKTAGSKEAGNTVTEKEFPGGVLMMVAAHSPVGLSSTPVGKIFMDEVDRYPLSAGGEGSPIELARARARTFSNKKIFIISTPTNEEESTIAKEFKDGNCEYYFVPCLGCGELFIITWDCITWEEGKPETTRCACPACGFLHEERHKTAMFAEKDYSDNGRAEWIATKKSSNPKKVSMHLSGLYSPAGFYAWEDAVRDFLKAEGDENKMRTFINTVLGETYKITGESPEYEVLYNRRESYKRGVVPEGVYFLTMGVDVQRDRLECEIVGWCPGRESWSIDYKVLAGDTSKDEVWSELTTIVNSHLECADGSLMHIALTAVDSGDNTKKVYDYCSKFPKSKVIPIKGSSTAMDTMVRPPKTVNVTSGGKPIKTNRVWYLGTSLLKTELYGFLGLKASGEDDARVYPPGYCHFPEYGEEYFKMLTAEEQRTVVDKKGYAKYEWVKKRPRNEALDVRCYARAAAYILGIDRFKEAAWEKIKKQHSAVVAVNTTAEAATKKSPKKKSNYWDR